LQGALMGPAAATRGLVLAATGTIAGLLREGRERNRLRKQKHHHRDCKPA
jgi:hypothetical protein